MSHPQRVIDDATKMSMLFILDQVPDMSKSDQAITEQVIRELLAEQDLNTYSTMNLLRYLRDIVSDYNENQADLADDVHVRDYPLTD